MNKTTRASTLNLATGAILTAMVIVLQYVALLLRPTVFSVSLVLVPIVIGAALCGPKISAWLGLVFGAVVLFSGDAAAFLSINAIGTVVTVLAKGTLCGLAAGLAYRLLEKWTGSRWLSVVVAAIVCPVVNTGIFALGCLVFFWDTLTQWAGGGSTWHYLVFVLIGANFLIEMLLNVVLAPVVVRLVGIAKKMK